MPFFGTADGVITTTINTTDNDGVGLMGRVVDENNYYRCHVDTQQGMAYLYKRVADSLDGVNADYEARGLAGMQGWLHDMRRVLKV